MLSKGFAVSPPYFDLSTLQGIERVEKYREIWVFLQQRIMHYGAMRPQTLHVMIMCFATLCYHFDFLKIHLHPESFLHAAPLFRDIPTEIKKYAVAKYSWDATKDTSVFTGIPPHVLHQAEMEGLRNEIVTLRLINERRFASTSANTEHLIVAVTTKQ